MLRRKKDLSHAHHTAPGKTEMQSTSAIFPRKVNISVLHCNENFKRIIGYLSFASKRGALQRDNQIN